MTRYGYTLMCEQTGPKELVLQARAAEPAGFDLAVMSDHYFPGVDEMGHSPYAWSVLGAVAHDTDSIGLMTYVTCPIKRYQPAVVAQSVETVSLLSDGRFTPGLGAGENLNEHVTGERVSRPWQTAIRILGGFGDLARGSLVVLFGVYSMAAGCDVESSSSEERRPDITSTGPPPVRSGGHGCHCPRTLRLWRLFVLRCPPPASLEIESS